MKNVRFTLPVKLSGYPVVIGHEKHPYFSYKNNMIFLVFNRWLLMFIILAFIMIWYVDMRIMQSSTQPPTLPKRALPAEAMPHETEPSFVQLNYHPDESLAQSDPIGYFLALFEHTVANRPESPNTQSIRGQFLIEKQIIVSRFLIEYKVARVSQLPAPVLLDLNEKVNQLFIELVLNKIPIEPHAYSFFASSTPLKKVETALMEQAKYNIPASIKLAQAAVETGYGKKVVENNYFGIKDKKRQTKARTTVEYYTPAELTANSHIVLSKKEVVRDGKKLYRCIVKDSFQAYASPWESFRAHSEFLTQNDRYAPLFTSGKDYTAWARKIGSSKYGGVGYATEPIYGDILSRVIERYHLDLLDF